jgi:hypothetical protein
MSDPERKKPELLHLELWTLKEWMNHRQVPFELKKDDFSIAWSPAGGGFVQFRLVGGGDHEHDFNIHPDGSHRGKLEIHGRQFEFGFLIAGASPNRKMKGDFYEIDKEGGPDPVASWGAEERGGGPILGDDRHERGEHRPEPAMRR